MWTKSVRCPMQMPSWPRWRPPFSRDDHGGLHADDVSEPHGDSGCDHLCVARVKCGAIIKFQQIPSRWWTSTASRNGRRDTARWCCPPLTEELSCQRKLLLLASGYEFQLVLRPEKEHHRIARHCPVRALLHRGRFRRAKRSLRAAPPTKTVTRKSCRE